MERPKHVHLFLAQCAHKGLLCSLCVCRGVYWPSLEP